MATDDTIGDELSDERGVRSSVLDVVERRRADLQSLFVFLVPLRDAGVQIPAVIVEARGVRDMAHVVERLVFEFPEADDDVRHLHSGIVDVVLHLDGNPAKALNTHERVAERGVSEMSDVRRLVRIDGGMLDDGLAART